MAFVVIKDYGNHIDITTKLQTLLNSVSPTTVHAIGIVKVGADRFLCWVAYE